MEDQPTYTLSDARVNAAEAPYTFFLPDRADVARLAPDDYAKLIFELIPPGEKYGAERMWVRITAGDGDTFVGTLENEPLEGRMREGDEVAFAPYNIIEIMWADGTRAPLAAPDREYWARCLVDDCVLQGEQPVEYVYREESDPELEEGGDEPDSGWRIRGRQGDASDEEMEERSLQYVALGAVLNRDDSWIHLIDAPAGSAFMRDFESGRYQPVAR